MHLPLSTHRTRLETPCGLAHACTRWHHVRTCHGLCEQGSLGKEQSLDERSPVHAAV